jgi:hypothetical protein
MTVAVRYERDGAAMNVWIAKALVDRFSHFVTILLRRSVYFQEKGVAVLA